jgi:hypothetical protein
MSKIAGNAISTDERVRVGTRAGVGYSENPNSRQAGIEAATAALGTAGIERPDVVLLYATSKADPAALLEGVRSVVGREARILGGSAVGIITNNRLGYEGHQVGVAVLASDTVKMDVFIARDIVDNEYGVGRALGEDIRRHPIEGEPNIVISYDIVRRQQSEGMSLNMATPLIAGLGEVLGSWPPTAGGGLTGDMMWNPTFQFLDDAIEQHAALALVLHGGARMSTAIMHGCKPSSGYHTITKADGNVVLEIDGRRAVDVVADLTGGVAVADWSDYPLFITLGINNGDPFGEYREDDYSVRLCMDVDRERGGLVFFGDDLVAGTQVQLMRRSINFDYIQDRTRALLDGQEGRRPFLALYIDCAGRAATYAGTEYDEAEEVQRAIGEEVPLFGWYVGCEIAKAGDRMQSHNWTGILCVLSEERSD